MPVYTIGLYVAEHGVPAHHENIDTITAANEADAIAAYNAKHGKPTYYYPSVIATEPDPAPTGPEHRPRPPEVVVAECCWNCPHFLKQRKSADGFCTIHKCYVWPSHVCPKHQKV